MKDEAKDAEICRRYKMMYGLPNQTTSQTGDALIHMGTKIEDHVAEAAGLVYVGPALNGGHNYIFGSKG